MNAFGSPFSLNHGQVGHSASGKISPPGKARVSVIQPCHSSFVSKDLFAFQVNCRVPASLDAGRPPSRQAEGDSETLGTTKGTQKDMDRSVYGVQPSEPKPFLATRHDIAVKASSEDLLLLVLFFWSGLAKVTV